MISSSESPMKSAASLLKQLSIAVLIFSTSHVRADYNRATLPVANQQTSTDVSLPTDVTRDTSVRSLLDPTKPLGYAVETSGDLPAHTIVQEEYLHYLKGYELIKSENTKE